MFEGRSGSNIKGVNFLRQRLYTCTLTGDREKGGRAATVSPDLGLAYDIRLFKNSRAKYLKFVVVSFYKLYSNLKGPYSISI